MFDTEKIVVALRKIIAELGYDKSETATMDFLDVVDAAVALTKRERFVSERNGAGFGLLSSFGTQYIQSASNGINE